MPSFIRVQSRANGHQFDVADTPAAQALIESGAFKRLDPDRWPPVDRPRQPKHRTHRPKPVQAPPAPTELPDTPVAGESPSRPAGHDATRKEADHG